MAHCTACGRFEFKEPTVCFWCIRKQEGQTDRRRRAAIRLGIMRSKCRARGPEVAQDKLEAARLRLHKYRRFEKGGGDAGKADRDSG